MLRYFFILFLTISCASNGKIEQNVLIGSDLAGNRYNKIYTSGQPHEGDISSIGQSGFYTVVNIRHPKEHDERVERRLVEKNGMTYHNIPFEGGAKLTDDFIDKVTSAVQDGLKKGKVLVHCRSGNRVGIWMGAYLYKVHEYSQTSAKEAAKRLGASSVEPLEEYFKTIE